MLLKNMDFSLRCDDHRLESLTLHGAAEAAPYAVCVEFQNCFHKCPLDALSGAVVSCFSTRTTKHRSAAQSGILDKYGCELIGAKLPSIDRAEDRSLFKNAMAEIGLKTPPSGVASTMEEAMSVLDHIGKFPVIIRPAFTLGGTGGGIAYNMDEYKDIIDQGLTASVTSQVSMAATIPYVWCKLIQDLRGGRSISLPACVSMT